MSLLIWLPLNNSILNQGTASITFNSVDNTSSIATTNGKTSYYQYSNSSYATGGFVSAETISLGQNQSIFAWVKFTSLSGDSNLGGAIAGQHRYPSNTGMGLTIKYVSSTTGYISVNTGNGSSRTYNTYCGNTLLQANTWYHLGYTYDGSTIRLYVNGTLDGSHAFTGMSTPTDYFMVGCWSFSASSGSGVYDYYKLNGYMNDLRAYNHTLSAKEVKELAKGLVLNYKFNFEDMYTPVDYIQSSGTQWIQTGLMSSDFSSKIIKCDISFYNTASSSRAYSTIIGCQQNLVTLLRIDSGTMKYFSNNSSQAYSGSVSSSNNYTVSYTTNYNNNTTSITVNGTTTSASSTASWGTNTVGIMLLASHNGGSPWTDELGLCRIYYCKFYDNDVLVRNFIPCIRNYDKKPGLFDLVNNVFYTNSGSGEFNVGINTKAYKLLDSIEFTGTQVIDSYITSLNASNFRIEIDFQRTETGTADSCLFGQRQFGKFTNIYNGYYESAYGNTAASSAADTNRHTLVMDQTGIYKDGTCLISGTISSISSSYSALIGAFSEDSVQNAKWFYKGKIYSIKIYNNGVLYKHFIPAIALSGGGVGLVELISMVHYSINGYAKGNIIGGMPLIKPTTQTIYTSNASVSGNTVTFSKPSEGWGNAGITSRQNFRKCVVETTVNQTTSYIMIGIASINTSYNYNQGYFIYPANNGHFYIYEMGNQIGDMGTYVAGDSFRVVYDGTYLHYYHNWQTVRAVDISLGKMYMNITTYSTSGSIKDTFFGDIDYDTHYIVDSSGYNNFGNPSSTIETSNNTVIGSTSAYLNNKWIIVDPANMPQYMDKMSVFMWVKQPTPTTQRFLFGTFNNWTSNGIGWWVDSGGTGLSNLVKVFEASSYTGGTNFGAVCDGNWHHIGVTWDGAVYKTYKDGSLVGSVTPASAGRIYNPVWYIGGALYNNEKMDGYLADVRVYVTALSQEDISELYNTRQSIDNSGNIYGNILNECDTKLNFKKNGTIGCNSLVESFNKTSLQSAYTELEYIKATGSQYIDLGTSIDCNYFELDCQYTGTATEMCIIGNVDNSSTNRWELFCDASRPYYNLWSAYNNQGTTTGAVSATTRALLKYSYVNSVFIVNDTNAIRKSITCQPRYLFQYGNGSYYAKAMLYGVTFIKNNKVVNKFVPCKRNSDNKIGLYDLINNNFYASSSSTAFEAGPEKGKLNVIYTKEIKEI